MVLQVWFLVQYSWELARNAYFQALPQTCKIQTLVVGTTVCVLVSPPGDSDEHKDTKTLIISWMDVYVPFSSDSLG